jgi:hypothetical protein
MMRTIWILLASVLCASCVAPYAEQEWKQQPLIFPESAAMSSGFASIEEDGRTVTLNAELGVADTGYRPGTLEIQRLPSVCVVTEGRQDMRIGPLEIARPGTQLYVAFSARAGKPGRLSLGVYRDGRLVDGLLKVLEPDKDWKRYRLNLRVLEPVDGLTLRIQTDAAVEIEEFGALRKTPANAETYTIPKNRGLEAVKDI